MPELSTLAPRLHAAGQGHLLAFADRLTPPQRAALRSQLEDLDLDALPAWIDRYVTSAPPFEAPASIAPAPYYPRDARGRRPWDQAAARARGEALLREGKVACFTVAGGQGSRLGYEGPKGCFPAGCVTGKPLFQIFAESIDATGRRYGKPVPWYIMTSPLNHQQTVAFFADHDHFGLDPTLVRFFPQGTMPSFDKATGRILLAEPGVVATNPDGHGGAVRALHHSGALGNMQALGIEHISYFQVDNPHAHVADPVFLGLHAGAPDSSAQVSSKMVAKAAWD